MVLPIVVLLNFVVVGRLLFVSLALTMPKSREEAVAVGAAHMARLQGWTVKKCLKSVLVAGTALYVLWSDEDIKHNPKNTFKGTIRIACVQYVVNGHTFLVYKDNGTRKVANADMEQVISFSNTVLASRQGGHVSAKEASVAERLCPAFDPDAQDSDEEDSENEGEDEEDSENEKDKAGVEDINHTDLLEQAAMVHGFPSLFL